MVEIGAFGVLGLYYWLILPALDRRRWRFALDISIAGLIWGALGIALLSMIFVPEVIPALIIAIMLHEYGHVLAYRLAGHRQPVFRLAPFGGVALSRDRFQSEVESAFVALMGPGFSIVLLAAAALVENAFSGTSPAIAAYAGKVVVLTGFLNLFNLLPLFPLDGGRVLASIASIGGPKARLGAAIVGSLAMAALAALNGLLILAIFAAAGMLTALAENRHAAAIRRMTLGEAALTVCALLAVAGAHAVAAAPMIVSLLTPR